MLPEAIQEMYIVNFNICYKLIIIFMFALISFLIIKNFKPKKSKYIMVKPVRSLYYVMSWICLMTLPFQFGFLSPNVSLSAVLNPLILFYSVNMLFLLAVCGINFLQFGSDFVKELFWDEKTNNPLKADLGKYFFDDTLLRK